MSPQMTFPIFAAATIAMVAPVSAGGAPALAQSAQSTEAPEAHSSGTHTRGRSLPPFPARPAAVAVQSGDNTQTREVADRAWALFEKAWATGEWQPFFDITTDDFEFYFPQGEFAGLHEGAEGKAKLVAWGNFHRQAGNRIRSALLRATYGGRTAVFETTAESIPPGAYRNYEVIIFEVRGDRISALREYWNVLEPSEGGVVR